MPDSSIKTYLAKRKLVKIKPGADAAYQRSIEKLVPKLTQKLRDSQALAAELRFSRTAASRSKTKKA